MYSNLEVGLSAPRREINLCCKWDWNPGPFDPQSSALTNRPPATPHSTAVVYHVHISHYSADTYSMLLQFVCVCVCVCVCWSVSKSYHIMPYLTSCPTRAATLPVVLQEFPRPTLPHQSSRRSSHVLYYLTSRPAGVPTSYTTSPVVPQEFHVLQELQVVIRGTPHL